MKKGSLFYGWWIVVACFVAMFVGSGTEWYTFSIFFKPLMSDFGWSRGEVSASVTIYFIVSGLVGPLVGRWVLRYGPRWAMIGGAVLAGASFTLLSFTNSLLHLWIGYGLSSAGIAALSFVPVTTVLSNWFVKRRGMATGIALTGMGFGGVVLAPLTGYIVDTISWRVGYLSLAAITLILVIPFCGLLIRRSPQEMGLLPDGLSSGTAPLKNEAMHAPSETLAAVWTVRGALKTSTFWLIAFAFFLAGLAATGVSQHQVPLLTDKGIPLVIASSALGIMGIMSIIGKLIFGHLTDRVPCRYVIILSFVLMATGIAILLLNSSVIALWTFVSVFGLGTGGIPALRPLSVAESFSGPSFPVIFGSLMMITTIGSAIGPLFSGYAFDVTGSYDGAFLGFVAIFAVAVVAILFARPPRRQAEVYPAPERVGEYAKNR